jgi:catechol 2,3-dioxygenase-like lactoylglutathione lyase family enzyme
MTALGRFHEISLAVTDIRESVEFYERLGFSHAATTDARSHPYGVLTDGRLFLGLHQQRFASPAITFVRPEIARHIPELEARGIELEWRRTGDEVFNEIAFRDPCGQSVWVLEARTYSPVTRRPEQTSLCGYFSELSLPCTDFAAAQAFWESFGFVATVESDEPYPHLPLTSDHFDIAFHRPRTFEQPVLVFRDAGGRERIERLRALGATFSTALPRGLDPQENALIEAPEGTLLLLLSSEI